MERSWRHITWRTWAANKHDTHTPHAGVGSRGACACEAAGPGARPANAYWSISLRWIFHFASEHTLQLAP